MDPARWQEAFECLMGRIAGRFKRVEPRRRVRRLVLGLLSDLPRKNCWTIAEWAGEATPDAMQHLLSRAKWDADAVRNEVRGYVVEYQRGHAAVDRELYLPRSWTTAPDRCRAAGLGEETAFATKPELAACMVARFLDAGHRAAWARAEPLNTPGPESPVDKTRPARAQQRGHQ